MTLQKNVAGQVVGCQLVDRTHSADDYTGTVTVYIVKDGGSQVIGSVGSGLAADKGHGYFEYLPSQEETNADHVAFSFHGAGAVHVTRYFYTIGFDPTVDLLARLVALDVTTGAVASGAATTTAIPTDLTETDTDYWKDAFFLITSGALAGQVRRVTGYNGTTKVLTVEALTAAPAAAVTFALVNR